jgi:hypothetical protein
MSVAGDIDLSISIISYAERSASAAGRAADRPLQPVVAQLGFTGISRRIE